MQALATELFKISNELSPDIVKETFQKRIISYNLRNKNSFMTRQVNSVYHGTESLSFLGPKIWDQVPQEIKESKSIDIFKSKIKKIDTFTLSV